MLESPEERRAELEAAVARGRAERSRRRTIWAAAVLAATVLLGVLAIVFDWGWIAWGMALTGAALALLAFSLRFGPVLRIMAVVVVAALVAAGIVAIRIPPLLRAGWSLGEDERVVAVLGDVVIVLDDHQHRLRGRASADGDERWAGDPLPAGALRSATDLGELVLIHSAKAGGGSEAAVVSAADGKVRWRRDTAELSPFTANGEVVVFTSKAGSAGLDLGTGRTVWSHPGRPEAGSGGNRSHPKQWIPRSEWLAFATTPDSRHPALSVINARTGTTATTVRPDSDDFLIAGDTFIEFGFARTRRVIRGTALAGGSSWVKEYDYDGSARLYDVVDAKARVLRDDKAAFIDPATGDVQETAIEDGWEVDWSNGEVDGRYALVARRDRDRRIAQRAVADTVKGGLLTPKGTGTVADARISNTAGGSMVLHEDVVDAVGGKSERYTFVADGAFRGQAALPEVVETFRSVGDVVQVDGRVVVLGTR